MICLENIDHQIICTITPCLQPVHIYLDILVGVFNVGVDSGPICVQVGHILLYVSCWGLRVYDVFINHKFEEYLTKWGIPIHIFS